MSFLILGGHRCGTHMLLSMLTNHPSIFKESKFVEPSENLNARNYRWPYLFFPHSEVKELKHIDMIPDYQGMIIHYYRVLQILDSANDIEKYKFLSWVYNRKIIHLIRENEEDRAISNICMNVIPKNKDGNKKAHDLKNMSVPRYSKEDIDYHINKYSHEKQRVGALLDLDDSLHVTYEWICDEKNIKTLDKRKSKIFCEFLDIENRKLTSSYTKNTYANSNC